MPETDALFAFPHPEAAPRDRHEAAAALERDAAALPLSGPIAGLVAALGAEMSRLVVAEISSHEAAPFLRPLGEEAFRLTGSVRGMRAIAWKASVLDPRHVELRRDLADKAWHGIGDAGSAWAA